MLSNVSKSQRVGQLQARSSGPSTALCPDSPCDKGARLGRPHPDSKHILENELLWHDGMNGCDMVWRSTQEQLSQKSHGQSTQINTNTPKCTKSSRKSESPKQGKPQDLGHHCQSSVQASVWAWPCEARAFASQFSLAACGHLEQFPHPLTASMHLPIYVEGWISGLPELTWFTLTPFYNYRAKTWVTWGVPH